MISSGRRKTALGGPKIFWIKEENFAGISPWVSVKESKKAMFKKMKKGQTTLEYVLLLTIVIGAFLAIQNYLKRGVQGRWRDAVDSLGDQYDPQTADTSIQYTLSSSTNTTIVALNTDGGYWTKRTDESSSTDRKTGTTTIGAY